MTRFGRRAFLTSSAGIAGGAAVAATADAHPAPDVSGPRRGLGQADSPHSPSPGRLRPEALTVNGVVDPVGVDPDDCSFAWTLDALDASGRSQSQTGYRIVLRRTDPGHSGTVWDSGVVPSARQAFVAHAGPRLDGDAAYEWTVQPRGEAGAFGPVSAPARFTTALRSTDWRASWLHPAASSAQPDRVTYLRGVVTPPEGAVARATVYVSAAHTYRLFVDSAPVDAWPSFSYADEQYARTADVTPLVRGGKPSALGVLHRWYGAGQGRPASFPGLLLQLSLWYSDGRHATFGSDASWRELPAEWLPSPQRNSDGGDFVEWVDGRDQPQDWSQPRYDDRAWSPATVFGPAGTAPFTRIFAQRTQITERVVAPVSMRTVTPGSEGSVVIDFGAVLPARPRVRFASGQAGRTITMHVGYLLDPDGQVATTHGTQGTNLSFSYVQRDGPQTFEAFTFLGFRYLQIDDPEETFGPDDVVALMRYAAPPAVPAATFSSGNRTLDAVWRLNARSCLSCSQEQFIDTPTREKGQFVWDAANESEAIMRAYGDQNMSWQGLRDVMRGQARYWPTGQVNAVYPNGDGARFIATFTARYPEWVWRYYLSTGDRDAALTHYTATAKVAAWLWSARHSDTGLLYGLGDTSNGDPVFGYDLNVAADTASNVLAVNAFNRVAQLAQLAGDNAGATTQRSRAMQLKAAVNAFLVRADGVYVDGVDANGAKSGHASQEANALALAYGVVPAANVAGVGAYVSSLGIDVGPNHGLELLRALAIAGRPADMVRILTDASIPGWAQILAKGGTFTWETWMPSDLIGDSMSHGWGSSALVAMQESLLGVSFDEPDRDGRVHVVVAPPSAGLPHASGSVPTIAGMLRVAWERSGRGLTLDLTVPVNAAARVIMSAASATALRENGVAAAKAPGVTVLSASEGLVTVSVGSGTYRFTSS